ncbi:MAG: hypothetical protein JW719_12540 [Pirellulales bacterium]|nr:hypothetical protein [Pirellulales bacterium]
MRHAIRTRSAGRSGDDVGMSLFPFLAVLICTVGALILVLVVLGRHARVEAARIAEDKKVETRKHLNEQLEDVRWRAEQLRESLAATRRQLVDARLQLGHIEDHSRQLRGELEALERDWNQLNATDPAPGQPTATEAQLQELSARIDQMKRRLADARRQAMTKKQAYAVVPYEGPNGTQRRPIYLECRSNAVVLQPEGIVFTEADFEGPMGSSNPLAAALRAAREHLLRSGQFEPGKSGEPYPLLLVRPRGIYAYYAARQAMSGWESDFGYEMVDDDWKLDFGAADPELETAVRQAIEAARARQVRLAEAAPRHYRHLVDAAGGERPQYTVSQGSGVVVPYGVADPAESDIYEHRRPGRGDRTGRASPFSGGDSAAGNATHGNSPNGPWSTGGGEAGSPGDDADPDGAKGNGGDSLVAQNAGPPGNGTWPPRTGSSGGPGFDAPNHSSSNAWDNGSGGSSNHSLNNSPRGSRTINSSGDSAAGARGGATIDAAGTATTGAMGSAADGSMGSSFAGSSGGSSGGSRSSAGQTVTAGSSDWNNSASAVAGNNNDSQTTGSPRQLGEWYPNSGDPTSGSSGPPSPNTSSHRREKSLADKRGHDWAVPEASRRATPLTQPIRIECHPDRIALVAQNGLAGSRSIALGPRTRDSVDELVSAIWAHTEGWGMAGNGMYWRPMLNVYVFPGAEERYADLECLLEDSGLLIERKNGGIHRVE